MNDETITFGTYKGCRWENLPLSYLRVLANQNTAEHPEWTESAERALSEIERRGVPSFEVIVLESALDAASLRVPVQWKEDRASNEGLCRWLHRVAGEAMQYAKDIKDVEPGDELRIPYKGVMLIIEVGLRLPVLKMVYPDNVKSVGPPNQEITP